MSTISNELVKDLRMAFSVWQQDYDPVEDKAQYDMFGLGIVAMDELLALRKEREKAEPVEYQYYYHNHGTGTGEWLTVKSKQDFEKMKAEYASNNDFSFRELYTAPPAPSTDDDSLPYDPQIAEYEQLMEAEQAQSENTSQQFELLAGKAVGSDGFECTPVADLYELLTKCGECYDYTTSAKVAADWIKEGYSAREYVKLDRLQEAMTQGSAGDGDGWIPCSERMPVEKDIVLVVDDGYFVCEAQYREGDFFSAVRGNNEFFETTCRDVEFWQPLPEPPCK
ncbi:DUF551 domain-containing protein [Cronobacter sakazakii]|uniref:DUF551 domain-containing protein n=1 Tax=Cronobacter sakazakii TaxID=28141 RepID=UPI002810AF4A|nr:DUF551 domain-containing protein [Cronobacter sakazakii]MDQ9175270.1 DUF551 domain-containing protein [Cronobacter sakazakii]MDQ9199847.1 DUF551 domain-containing protein [Cronobacter sakazakii]